jgi:hypothetical protein
VPISIGPIGADAGALAVSFEDCHEEALESLSQLFGVQHRAECTNPEFFRYPVFKCSLFKFNFRFSFRWLE